MQTKDWYFKPTYVDKCRKCMKPITMETKFKSIDETGEVLCKFDVDKRRGRI